MHRVRDRLVWRRTALINEIRGFLLERGITFPMQKPTHLRKIVTDEIEAFVTYRPRSPSNIVADRGAKKSGRSPTPRQPRRARLCVDSAPNPNPTTAITTTIGVIVDDEQRLKYCISEHDC